MTGSIVWIVLASAGIAAPTPRAIVEQQEVVFESHWAESFEWQLDELPEKGRVPKSQVPYSGYIYPDREGGTSLALKKYERAFRSARGQAVAWEKKDTEITAPTRGLLGLLGHKSVPYWHGHCNGWTAATMRHAEPRQEVERNGVTFAPADIKALLAELYIYNDAEILAGIDRPLDAGIFHAILTNWIGRGAHPVAMDADPTKEKWNYPIYGYSSAIGESSGGKVEVKTNILFAKDSEDGEYNDSPLINDVKYFHYMLQLDRRGNIIGGEFLRDSEKIDFMWIPLSPKQGGEPGNDAGNPHLDAEEVLAIWRDSVPPDARQEWVHIDPENGAHPSLAQQQQRLADEEQNADEEEVVESRPRRRRAPREVVTGRRQPRPIEAAPEADESRPVATVPMPAEARPTATVESIASVGRRRVSREYFDVFQSFARDDEPLEPVPDPAFSSEEVYEVAERPDGWSRRSR